MEKRARSPNYPSISLPEALDKVMQVYQVQHTHRAPREVVVRSMGYAGINGASATAISALHKYGLLEGRGDDIRVSDRAMRFISPLNDDERRSAIREAATSPELFQELSEKFPGPLPGDDILHNYLIRNGFSKSAVSGVISAYRETMTFAEREAHISSAHVEVETARPSVPDQVATPAAPVASVAAPSVLGGGERSLGRHDFEDGTFVRISASQSLDTEEALDWVEFLVEAKRRELKMRQRRSAPPPNSDDLDRLLE